MTSLLRKSRRTTVPATSARRTAISLAAWVGFAGAAAAQPPAPPVLAPPPAPAATVWTPPPAAPVVAGRPLPRLEPLSPPPGTTVQFQKPPGDAAPYLPAVPAVRPFPTATTAPVVLPFQDVPQPAPVPGTPDREAPKKDAAKPTDKPGAALPTTPGALPQRDDVFRLEDDAAIDRRILKALDKPATAVFPPKPEIVAAGTKYQPKTSAYPATQVKLEPNYVVHRRLYFEELNSERHGWDAGPAQPIFSSLLFAKDVAFWPHNLASGLWRDRYDVSPGKCRPGDPVPYYVYPPGFTVSGSVAEAVLVTGVAFILP